VGVVVTALLVKVSGRFGAKWKLKALLAAISVAVFILIPTWDVIPAQHEFERLCQSEAGVKIYKSAEGVEGFISVFSGVGVAEDFLKNYGYRFVEGTDVFTHWVRYSLDAQGRVVTQKIDGPMARYRIEEEQVPLKYVYKTQVVIEDAITKEKLATKTAFFRLGGWFDQLKRVVYEPCRGNDMRLEDFLTKTLIPVGRF
jgi:hypothetical protein